MTGHERPADDFRIFRICSKCGVVWPTRESFLEDRDLWLIGYQADFEDLVAGLFLFNHSCFTTLAVEAEKFQDLNEGPIFAERLTGTAECRQFCFRRYELRPCPAKCEYAFVREILQIIKNWPKRKNAASSQRELHG
jgi:hypothetical protein